MLIGLSHGGSNVYDSSAPVGEVLVGTMDGVLLLQRDGGAGWRTVAHGLKGREVSSVAVASEEGLVFAGAFNGGVFASQDGGRSWEQRDGGITHPEVWSLHLSRTTERVRLYAGTQPAHLYYSDTLGQKWMELPALRQVPSVDEWSFPPPPHIAHTKFIATDPHIPTTIYACIEQGTFLRSNDDGATWEELNDLVFFREPDRPKEKFYDTHKVLIDPRNTDKLYVTGGAGLYVTEDGGKTWERWTSADWAADVYPDGLVHNPRDPDLMFLSAAAHNPVQWMKTAFSESRIFRSHDAGWTWQVLSGGLPASMQQEIGALCIQAWDGGVSVFAGTTAGEVFLSQDAGDHWERIAEGFPPVAKKGHDALLSAVA